MKSGYYAAEGRNYLGADETAEFIALNESIARMLRRWQAKLTPLEQTRKEGKDRPRTTDHGPGTDQDLRTKNQGPRGRPTLAQRS
jgi:hypothetical protein